MIRKIIHNDKVFDVVVTSIVILVLIGVAYPLYFIIIASFSNPDMVASGKVMFIPKGISFEGYSYIYRDIRIWTGYMNSIIYAVSGTFIALIITIPGGYALSRDDLKGRKAISLFMVFTMYFSGGLIPTYLVVKQLGLIDTRLVLIILGSFSVFNLIITRAYYANSLPKELQEAAEVDGCTTFKYFVHVVIPLSKPIIAIIALYYVVHHWNSFFNALIYVNNVRLYPLQLILRDILIQGQTIDVDTVDPEKLERLEQIARTIKYGVIIVSSLPVMLIYPFVQKYFVKGIFVGSVKS